MHWRVIIILWLAILFNDNDWTTIFSHDSHGLPGVAIIVAVDAYIPHHHNHPATNHRHRPPRIVHDTNDSRWWARSKEQDDQERPNPPGLYFADRRPPSTSPRKNVESKNQFRTQWAAATTTTTKNKEGHALSSMLVLLAILALGAEAMAQSSSSSSSTGMMVANIEFPLIQAASDVASDVVEVLIFLGDLFGSVLNLIIQVLLVLLPIAGKACVAAGQAAFPVIQDATLTLLEYLQIAVKAFAEAAMPIMEDATQTSMAFWKQMIAMIQDAASSTSGGSSTIQPPHQLVDSSGFQNVAAQATTTTMTILE